MNARTQSYNLSNTSRQNVESGNPPPKDNWEWNRTWDMDKMPSRHFNCILGATISTLVVFFIVLGFVLGSSTIVDFEHNAVMISTTGNTMGAESPGRRFHGPGGEAVLFPRFDQSIEYTVDAGNSIEPRVLDGQILNLDLSFQYYIPEDSLENIYREHRKGFDVTLSNLARAILRDVAAGYKSEDFFTNRTFIEEEMRNRVVAEGVSRGIKITGFQVRNVRLPDLLLQRLVEIQIARQDARAREEELVLEKIRSDNRAIKLGLSTNRTREIAEYNQTTSILVTLQRQETRQIEERTNQLVTEIRENSNRTVQLYNRETDVREEAFFLNTTIEQEETRRQVDQRQFESETTLQVYYQETENLRLEYDRQETIITEQTAQNVSNIHLHTAQEVETLRAELRIAMDRALAEARTLIAEAREIAANKYIDATSDSLDGRPSGVYLAQHISNDTLTHVNYLDITMNGLQGLIDNSTSATDSD